MTTISAQQRDREKVAINRLRANADRRSDDTWTVEDCGGALRLIVRRSTGEDAHVATIHPDALDDERDLICGALGNLLLFLRLFDRAADTVRDLNRQLRRGQAQQQQKNYSAQAAMLLSDRAFQRFLESKGAGGPVRDKGSADTRLKSLLAISSKSQINTVERAQAAFLALRGEFEAWKRGGAS
jgi:hypothetical protein